jgi:O-antigen ligase
MRIFSAIILWLTIVVSVAVMWVRAKWPTTIPEAAVCVLASAWMVLFAIGRRRPRLSIALIPLGGVVLWAGIQLLIGSTVYRWPTRMAILYWSGNFATFFIGLQIFGDRILRNRFLRALVLFGFVVGVISPLQALTTNGKVFWMFQTDYTSWYVFGPFVYTNQYAAFIELLLPVALHGALTNRRWRVFDTLVVAVMYTSVLASASRFGTILTTLEILIVPLLVARKSGIRPRKLAAGAALLTGMIVLLAIAVGPKLLLDRFAQKDPYAQRREFVESSFKMVRDNPLLGVGLGNWATAYPGYALFDDGLYANQAHNDWVQWTVEGGFPLLALMLWVACWGIPRGLSAGWGAGIAAIFLHCFVDYPIQRTGVALVLFTLLAAVAVSTPDGPVEIRSFTNMRRQMRLPL